MLASVIQIGNSRGIRLPKRIFHELNIKDKVELIINKDELIVNSTLSFISNSWKILFGSRIPRELPIWITEANIITPLFCNYIVITKICQDIGGAYLGAI